MLVHETVEVRGGCRKLPNKQRHNLFCSSDNNKMIRPGKMGRVHVEEKFVQNVDCKSCREKTSQKICVLLDG